MRQSRIGRWFHCIALGAALLASAACGGNDGGEEGAAGSIATSASSVNATTSTGGAGGSAGAGVEGGNGGGGSGGGDAGGADAQDSGPLEAGADGIACGAAPHPDEPWITTYQQDIVARLSGYSEIAPGTRLVNRATMPNRAGARQYLAKLLTDLGMIVLEQNYGTGINVYAELRSTSGARQYVVIGAHFDSVLQSPGANDNATGVAAVLTVARYLANVPCRSRHFFFVLFDEEERGLVGSKNFATKLLTDGVSVHSVHTIDQMGWDQNDDRLIELELPDMGLAELYQTAVAELGVSLPIRITKTGSTDHSSFRPAFLATGVTEGYVSGDTAPYYHTAGDTYETVKFAYLKATTVLIDRVMVDLSR